MMVMVFAENWYSFTWLIAGNAEPAVMAGKKIARRGGLCIEKFGF
jgi:hypothetical protein